jgi:hypothetical protein
MLNIISRSYCDSRASGPNKVVHNLIKGLEEIDYPYVTNKDLDYGDWLWVHDDAPALLALKKYSRKDKVVVGPNIIIPEDPLIDYASIVLLQPSPWTKDFCLKFRFRKSPVEVWPTGLDTAMFTAAQSGNRKKVLVYFKQRFPEELAYVENLLKAKGLDYEIIRYNHYQENDYLNSLQEAKYVIWIGRQESQGVAFQEALASDIPVLVWDVPRLGHWRPDTAAEKAMFTFEESDFREATAAPYFEARCGYKVLDKEKLLELISELEAKYLSFRPREFVLENLSLERQARALLEIFKKYNPDKQEADMPVRAKMKKWRHESLWRLAYRARRGLRKIIKK